VRIAPQLVFQPLQAGDVDVTFADISKAHTLLGYAPHTSLAEGLEKFVAWEQAMAPSRSYS
jgi:nucleoside-diphosphate-sugar epimerase